MLEIIVAVALIALNGLFALSELAIVSARKSRLEAMARAGQRGAQTALRLAEDSGRFLSTVQIGITLIGVLAGAFSGAALGAMLTDWLAKKGLSPWLAEPAGFGLVLGVITYLSVVVGELVPKQLALRNPEGIACAMAPVMSTISRLTGPVVWVLDASTRLLFKVFGKADRSGSEVTDEEIKSLVAEAADAGVIERDEHRMISGVLRLGDRAARALMTPRTDVEWLNISGDEPQLRETLQQARHSRLPVARGSVDEIVGVLRVKDLLPDALAGRPLDVAAHMKSASGLPDTVDALYALKVLQRAEIPMAIIQDEYGHFEGLITPADILDAIAGAFRSDDELVEEAIRRDDGCWLLSGSMPADEAAELLAIRLPEGSYETLAGLIIGQLRRLPATGEQVSMGAWRLEVIDLDGRRVDKVLAHPTVNAS